jgi:hypothetical protein
MMGYRIYARDLMYSRGSGRTRWTDWREAWGYLETLDKVFKNIVGDEDFHSQSVYKVVEIP